MRQLEDYELDFVSGGSIDGYDSPYCYDEQSKDVSMPSLPSKSQVCSVDGPDTLVYENSTSNCGGGNIGVSGVAKAVVQGNVSGEACSTTTVTATYDCSSASSSSDTGNKSSDSSSDSSSSSDSDSD